VTEEKQTNQPTNRPTRQSTHPHNQPTKKSTNKPNNQATSKAINEPTKLIKTHNNTCIERNRRTRNNSYQFRNFKNQETTAKTSVTSNTCAQPTRLQTR